MKNVFKLSILILAIGVIFVSCSDDDAATTSTTTEGDVTTATLHNAFSEFNAANTTITLNGTNVTIQLMGCLTIRHLIGPIQFQDL